MPSPLWFKGVCDKMLERVMMWAQLWHLGDEYATRDRFNETGTGIEKVVTVRRLLVVWRREELGHLIRILREVQPEWLDRFDVLFTGLQHVEWDRETKAAKALERFDKSPVVSGDLRTVHMYGYEDDPRNLLALLRNVKSGTVGLNQQVDEQLAKEGPLWG
jgi:hypothetical protein